MREIIRRRWFVSCTLRHSALLITFLWGFSSASIACPGGWFDVKAIVVRINPTNAKVLKKSGSGNDLMVLRVDDTLCRGETILFSEGDHTTVVEVLRLGKVVSIPAAGGPYTFSGGIRKIAQAVSVYVDAVLDASKGLRVPIPLSNATAGRGGEIRPFESVRPVLHLRFLPRQRLTLDANPIVGWRGGAAPYKCEVKDHDAIQLWQKSNINGALCVYSASLDKAARIIIRDARGHTTGWNIDPVTWEDVPRPDWLPLEQSNVTLVDLTAWGLWLWKEASAQWRLQSLAMLNRAASEEWLAAYLRDAVLVEIPVVEPCCRK